MSVPARHPPPWRQLLLLALVAATGIYARSVVGPLQEAVRLSMGLDDVRMGWLQGPTLALPPLLGAVPLGVAIRRMPRSWLLAGVMGGCVLATVGGAMAPGFPLLFLARCCVGFCAPASAIVAYSILGDLFAPAARGRAITAVMLSQVLGSSAAFALGGLLLQRLGPAAGAWRPAMVAMGLAMIPAVGAALAVRDPARAGQAEASGARLWPELWRFRGLVLTLAAGMTLVNIADGAALVWAAPTLQRSFGLGPGPAGGIVALALLVGGVAGPSAGGAMADLCQKRGGPSLTGLAMTGVALANIPTGLFPILPDPAAAAVALAFLVLFGAGLSAMVTALSITAVPASLRGLCMTLQYAAGAVFGFGGAPLATSLLSESLGGPAMIGTALCVVCISTSILGVIAFANGRRFLARQAAGAASG